VSDFHRYPHVERFGKDEVLSLPLGECHVFPKLDGSNASAWLSGAGLLHLGSRNRDLTAVEGSNDNLGFREHVRSAPLGGQLLNLLREFPDWHLFGEWLVPHTFRQYRPEAWRRFWIFDVYDRSLNKFISYEEYSPLLACHQLDYVEPLALITNPAEADLRRLVESNTYLVVDGAGPGEGIVVKRYDFLDPYGRPTWAKLVRNEFKEENRRAMGTAEPGASFQPELDIAERTVTQELVNKERSRLESLGIPRAQLIPRLLQVMYHCIITEELWDELKRLKNPTLDFRLLQRAVTEQTKKQAADLFG